MTHSNQQHNQAAAGDAAALEGLEGLEEMLKQVLQGVIADEPLAVNSPLLVRDLEWAVADSREICAILSDRSLSRKQLQALSSLQGALNVAQSELVAFIEQLQSA